jgi:ribosomal protein S27E
MTQGTVQRDKIYVYHDCQFTGCPEKETLVYLCGDELYCAQHTREYVRKNPVKPQCDRCGNETKVFRDPSHRRNEYLCINCHLDDGFLARDSVTERAVLEALKKDEK